MSPRPGEIHPVPGTVIGLAGDELTERKYLVIDGIDGRAHYVEIAEPDQLDSVDVLPVFISCKPAIICARPPKIRPSQITGPMPIQPTCGTAEPSSSDRTLPSRRPPGCQFSALPY